MLTSDTPECLVCEWRQLCTTAWDVQMRIWDRGHKGCDDKNFRNDDPLFKVFSLILNLKTFYTITCMRAHTNIHNISLFFMSVIFCFCPLHPSFRHLFIKNICSSDVFDRLNPVFGFWNERPLSSLSQCRCPVVGVEDIFTISQCLPPGTERRSLRKRKNRLIKVKWKYYRYFNNDN